LDVNSISDTVGAITIVDGAVTTSAGSPVLTASTLTMTGGSVNMGTGQLKLTNNVTYNSGASSTIAGILNLTAANTTFTVADGPSANDLIISAAIAGNAITKAGAGTLFLNNANNAYTGVN